MLRPLLLAAVYLAISPLTALAEPMKFNYSGNGGNCDDCEFLVAKGDITPSTVDEFRALDVRNSLVMLDSKGGNLLAAIALGNEFRRRNIRVMVGAVTPRTDGSGMDEIAGTCESACVYAFFGGSRREVGPGSKVGIHSLAAPSITAGLDPVYIEAEITNVQIQVGVVLEFTQRMGIDPIVVQWASEVPNDDMRYLTEDELRTLRIEWNPLVAQPFRLEPYKKGILARTESTDGKVKATLFCIKKQLRLTIGDPPLSEANKAAFSPENEPNVANLIPSLDLHGAGMGTWTESPVTTRADANGVYRIIALTKEATGALSEAKWVFLSFGGDRASGALSWRIYLPTDNIPQLVPLLTRNCLG